MVHLKMMVSKKKLLFQGAIFQVPCSTLGGPSETRQFSETSPGLVVLFHGGFWLPQYGKVPWVQRFDAILATEMTQHLCGGGGGIKTRCKYISSGLYGNESWMQKWLMCIFVGGLLLKHYVYKDSITAVIFVSCRRPCRVNVNVTDVLRSSWTT